MDTIKLIYAICVFLVGLGLAISNIVLHYIESCLNLIEIGYDAEISQ